MYQHCSLPCRLLLARGSEIARRQQSSGRIQDSPQEEAPTRQFFSKNFQKMYEIESGMDETYNIKANLLTKTESDISRITQHLVLSVYGMIGVSFPMLRVDMFSNIYFP